MVWFSLWEKGWSKLPSLLEDDDEEEEEAAVEYGFDQGHR